MSTERTILESLTERQREIEALIQAKKEEVAQLKRQLQKVKKAQVALDSRPTGAANTPPPSLDND